MCGRKSLFTGIVLVLFALSNCKKPEDIGIDTLPSEDLLYTDASDSATVFTTTVREDSLRADELSRIVFGSIRDTAFGLTNAEYFGQVLLSSTPNLIGDSSHLPTSGADSLVLTLAYSGYFGDTAVPVNIHVYRMTEDMIIDSTYYSNKTFQSDSTNDLVYNTPQSFSIRPYTPVVVGTDTNQTPHLRIRLNDVLRDEIFGRNSQPEFASNDNWKNYFKGIRVNVDPVSGNGGALMYVNPTGAYTRLTLYYHEDTIPKNYSFTMSGGARVNHADHDFTGSAAEIQLQNPTVQYDVNYLKSMAGLKTIVSFPYLKHFTDSGSILINKAELVINVLTDTSTYKPVPESILFLAKNSSDKYEFPIDYYERSYGGSYSVTTRTYTFDISRTIQRILDNTITDYGYSLNILGSMVAGNSVAIGGGLQGNSQMKLKLYYTKLH